MSNPLEQLIGRWRALQLRERRLVAGGVVLTAAVLLYMLAFEPAWQGRRKLEAELPELRAQVAQMDALAGEARKLSGTGATIQAPQQLKGQIEQSVAAAGLAPSLSQLTVSGQLIEARFKQVGFAPWLAWLDTTLRETRMRAVDIAVNRESQPGQVSARITFEAPKRSQ